MHFLAKLAHAVSTYFPQVRVCQHEHPLFLWESFSLEARLAATRIRRKLVSHVPSFVNFVSCCHIPHRKWRHTPSYALALVEAVFRELFGREANLQIGMIWYCTHGSWHSVYKSSHTTNLTPSTFADQPSSKVQNSLAVRRCASANCPQRRTKTAFSDVQLTISGCNALALALGRFVFLPAIREKVRYPTYLPTIVFVARSLKKSEDFL